jgi:hypothetical protein
MKRLTFILLLTVLIFTSAVQQAAAQQGAASAAVVELTFTFTRQGGAASNQFAVWIEDTEGKYIKSLYATRYTANGGYSRRPSSIPAWVLKSGLSNMTKPQVDAITGATPQTGALTYTWDGTDSRGAVLPAGDYILVLEGTLRWENQVYYMAPITIGKGSMTSKIDVEYVGTSTAERSMIRDVRVRVLR